MKDQAEADEDSSLKERMAMAIGMSHSTCVLVVSWALLF